MDNPADPTERHGQHIKLTPLPDQPGHVRISIHLEMPLATAKKIMEMILGDETERT